MIAKPKQAAGPEYGLRQERVLILIATFANLEKAYIVEHGDSNLPGRFVFEHMRGVEMLGQAYGIRSDDVVFLETVEHMLRERGVSLQYPTGADHVWLQPDQFAIPADWKVFADESSGCNVKRERFYGFGDAGGIAGDFAGYETREACVAAVRAEWWPEYGVGTKPEELGEYATCALSGDEYVNRLQTLDSEGALFYGRFVS